MMPEIWDYKIILLLVGMALAGVNYTRYIIATLKGRYKPHMFSWGIWALLSFIAFAAQWSEDAGLGMWQNAFMGSGTLLISIIAFFCGNKTYTRSDWTALLASLAAIPLWIATNDPLWSVILITLIDAVAFLPTVRKTWNDPHMESPEAFFLGAVTCALGLAALTVFNTTTVLYPLALVLMNLSFVIMIYARRPFTKPI